MTLNCGNCLDDRAEVVELVNGVCPKCVAIAKNNVLASRHLVLCASRHKDSLVRQLKTVEDNLKASQEMLRQAEERLTEATTPFPSPTIPPIATIPTPPAKFCAECGKPLTGKVSGAQYCLNCLGK